MPQQATCSISGETFTVSDHEISLRKQFGFDDLPTVKPKYRLQYLGAFYPNWALHARGCDKTGKQIISSFSADCPYPVWDRKEWFASANPLTAQPDFDRPFFDQARELFFQCPIPHIFQHKCENCEYTDDWYESRDCYLCHGGDDAEGVRYSAHVNSCKDCICCTLIEDSQWCYDCINCQKCHSCRHCLDVRSSSDCAMSYNLRNCQHCLFCFNLRGKQYCIGNSQLTKEEYEKQLSQWKLETRDGYEKAKTYFEKMMKEIAWIRALYVEHAENSSGNYLSHIKDAQDCFMLGGHENAYNAFWAGREVKHVVDGVGTFGCQGGYQVSVPIRCFEVRMCFMSIRCRFSDYLGYCVGSENCFGSCGLHQKNHCVLNAPYAKEEYERLRTRLIDHMKSTGEWGEFFPYDFAPNPYDESLSGYFFPLTHKSQKSAGYRTRATQDPLDRSVLDSKNLPQSPFDADGSTVEQGYWDSVAQKPFRILPNDVNFCRKVRVPLPNKHYTRSIFENLAWLPFDGELRETTCAKTGASILTSWPSEYDGRIVSEEAYLQLVG